MQFSGANLSFSTGNRIVAGKNFIHYPTIALISIRLESFSISTMKTLGIIGGVAPESTIEYYRLLIATYREKDSGGNYPPLILNSINLKKMVALITAGNLAELTEYLLEEINKLARAGAHIGLLASNTPHIVFDRIQPRSPIPLISIVESACAYAKKSGFKRVGLFGTRFTMQGKFYPQVFSREGIEIITPDPEDQEYIHTHYMDEFINGIFLDETRSRLLEIINRLNREKNVEALILGGTELPLILHDSGPAGIPLLDTTKIHVEAAVAYMLS